MTPAPLNFHNLHTGVLDWIDAADATGQVVVELIAKPRPADPKQTERWLKKTLKSFPHRFFFVPLVHAKGALPFEVVSYKKMEGYPVAFVNARFPLAALLNLPNQNPTKELARLRTFFQWACDKARATGRDSNAPSLEWVCEEGDKGPKFQLQWVGLKATEDAKEWKRELKAWRDKGWFADWHDRNQDALKRRQADTPLNARLHAFQDSSTPLASAVPQVNEEFMVLDTPRPPKF